jgi:REP element-mobilizing transposase RayT
MNRRVDRRTLFESAADYDAFSQILGWAQQMCEMPITAWCLMPNHWHLIVKPRDTPHLSSFMHRIQTTHAVGLRRKTDTRGHGSVYGNRFKHFLIHPDRLLRSVVYVERNPVKAGLVRAATSWTHGSASAGCVDTAWPRVERLPAELERLRPELLLHPLPEEFESDFMRACRATAAVDVADGFGRADLTGALQLLERARCRRESNEPVRP